MTPEQRKALDRLEAKFAAMPDPADLPRSLTTREFDAYEIRRRLLTGKIAAARAAQDTLAEVQPEIAILQKQRDDLQAIKDECSVEKVAAKERRAVDLWNALDQSIKACNGTFDLLNEAIILPFPLFEKLAARGYVGHGGNPMKALYGSLHTITDRLEHLEKRRDAAIKMLAVALRDEPVAV